MNHPHPCTYIFIIKNLDFKCFSKKCYLHIIFMRKIQIKSIIQVIEINRNK